MRISLTLATIIACSTPALAADETKNWMLTASSGAMSRDDDATHGFGSVAITRRFGKAYIRATLTRFDYSIRQIDVRLPSTYMLGYISGGATFGHWFVDAYGMGGAQRYLGVETGLGRVSLMGSDHSAVYGGGADGGYMKWFSKTWSLTPSIAVNYVHSIALRELIGQMGPSNYMTNEAGITGSVLLRLDHRFGRTAQHDVDLYVSRDQTSNRSAALTSGTRGIFDNGEEDGKRSDGWTEVGGGLSFLVGKGKRLYLDAGALRTIGAQSGDVTTISSGFRFLF